MEMRTRNTGTFDKTTNTWRIKGKGIQASIRKLSKLYGVELPKSDKKASLPYWRRYLQDIEDGHRQAKKAASPLPSRIQSLEAMIDRFKAINRPTEQLERSLTQAIETPAWEVDVVDAPCLHPDVQAVANLDPDLAIEMVNNLMFPVAAKKPKDRLRDEADRFIARKKQKSRAWYNVRGILDMLMKVTGDISIHQLTVHHYRAIHDKVKNNEEWADATKADRWTMLRIFLNRLEADHGCNYPFLRNPDYNFQRPDGEKEQYTLEQLRIALDNATGDMRLMVLLGLNCGMIRGDIIAMTPETIQGEYLNYIRAKLLNNPKLRTKVKGSWLLWQETKESLEAFSWSKQKTLGRRYTTFKDKWNLPDHKALRKTTAQLIHDFVGENEARLFRGESVGGTHGKSYIRAYTPAQIEKLGNALITVGQIYKTAMSERSLTTWKEVVESMTPTGLATK